jgi:hypothetical protein
MSAAVITMETATSTYRATSAGLEKAIVTLLPATLRELRAKVAERSGLPVEHYERFDNASELLMAYADMDSNTYPYDFEEELDQVQRERRRAMTGGS